MSYLLFFWKERPGATIRAETLIDALEDGEAYHGLVEMPFDALHAAFRRHFPEVRESEGVLSWSDEGSHFEAVPLVRREGSVTLVPVYCSKCAVTAQRVRAVADALGCRVYDPQQG